MVACVAANDDIATHLPSGCLARRPLVRATCLLLICCGLQLSLAAKAAERPNVVLIITDDQGYGDLGCHGNPILKTPHLDTLHGESIRLVDYHVAPTCSPTRAALLTGHWTNRTGAWHTIMGRSLLRHDERTLGQMFRDAGYATAMFGKWHLGDNYPFRPEDRGFEHVLRHGGGGVGQTPDYWDNAYFDDTYFRPGGKPIQTSGFCTDVWFADARRFIEAQQEQGRPFMAYIATNAAHGPMHSPTAFSQPYADLGVPVANFFGMIANIDHNVGELRQFLRERGLAENTIFIFTTDNGTAAGGKVHNAGMRGHKGSEFDGGHRVPFFVYWPAGGLTGGRDVERITAHVDIAPTLLDLCGIDPPADVRFDGRSLKPLLTAKAATAEWPDRILVTDSQRVRDPIKWKQSAVMTDRWRLVNRTQLYEIQADPGQQQDVATAYPDVVARLQAFYEAWWAELEPTFARDCRIVIGAEQENPSWLTSHDWITGGGAPWNQGHIRRGAAGENITGFWNIRVAADGQYTIRVRRWPRELGRPIVAPLDPGPDVPGVKAIRTTPGRAIDAVEAILRIDDHQWRQPVATDAEEVVFQVELNQTMKRLSTRFVTRDGTEIGAYYAGVER